MPDRVNQKVIGAGGKNARGGQVLLLALLSASGLALPALAAAQVMEIGVDGGVKVYDRPTVFYAVGAAPMEPARPAEANTGRIRNDSGEALVAAAQAAHLSPDLVEAIAWRESRFRPRVVSRAGAVGEMQLMPATARSLGVNPYDTKENYRGGATYLGALLRRYDGDLTRALAAYNSGPAAVDRFGGVPPFKETRAYVAAIMDRLSQRVAPFIEAQAER